MRETRGHARGGPDRARRALTRLIVCLSIAGLAAASAAAHTGVERLGRGGWSWFADPRALELKGEHDQIIVGWIDQSGFVTVASVDRRTGHRRVHVVGHLYGDDHGAPALVVEPDKRITVFYAAHNGSRMYTRTTDQPEDVTSWGPEQTIPPGQGGQFGYTYPNPVMLSREHDRLWLFWRGGDWEPTFATRTLGGEWSSAHELITAPGARPYMKVATDRKSRIGFAFTDGHPRDVLTSIYYMAYRHGGLYTAGGRRIGAPGGSSIRPSPATVVYDAHNTHVPSWVDDVAFDRRGHPVITFETYPSRAQHHRYWYARWTGQRWALHQLVDGGPTISPGTLELEYSGGIVLDHREPGTVYLSRKIGPVWQIERWVTRDGGVHWQHVQITSGSTSNIRPVVVRDSSTERAPIVWLRGTYGTYTSFGTSVVLRIFK
jgi:hypothetical protein